MVIGAGQLFIYWSTHVNAMSASDQTTRQSHDLTFARRLLTVAMSDFLCWFYIGLLGLLASSGTPIGLLGLLASSGTPIGLLSSRGTPIGLLGLLASSDTPIPGEVSVTMAIFVLPFNSALNPFFYTLNVVLEKRRVLNRWVFHLPQGIECV